ncbi:MULTISPECIES: hypothetical protein [Pseudomonas]|uniref:hypothetical protein n=1 Tax=Pseudomonas TaxID=286 RepID=UPI000F7AC951|nr:MULTISPECIES: hypothetical protein [Pseudomonas]MBH3372923.1 hypothetical protein [Pseudomonas juntendi]QEQ88712.1 hypothetical protein F1602_15900 [Pseudomonas putida]QKL02930.1 hypothetical protein GEV39_16760 [Pseudomonas sp. NY5710]
MKHCNQCGAQKAVSDFYPRRAACKDCVKAKVRLNYAQNREHYREYERSRFQSQHRVEARNRYAASKSGRDRSNAAKAAYIERNRAKRDAHMQVENAVKRGDLWKSPCCMAPDCFSTTNIQGHHAQYEDPLSVVWLCAKCHAQLHREHRLMQGMAET